MEEDQGGKRQQIMVTLSSDTTVDLFGPHEVKNELKTKTKLKEWGMVFCCLVSKAMNTHLVSDQPAKGILVAD